MNKWVFMLILYLVFVLFIVKGVSSECGENQININTASSEELQQISGIGPVYAERIIELRPFESVDDLVRVSGIGEISLENMKNSSPSPCVEKISNVDDLDDENFKENISDEREDIGEDIREDVRSDLEELKSGTSGDKPSSIYIQDTQRSDTQRVSIQEGTFEGRIPITQKTIKLNPKENSEKDTKDIKSLLDEKERYAVYGLVTFCVLLLSLFIAKRFKFKKYQI